jgi:hypothetical protein
MPETIVQFPLIGNPCCLGSVSARSYGAHARGPYLTKGGKRVFELGADDAVEGIVRAARFRERGGRTHHGVAVELDIGGRHALGGESYGLALAIADYLARLGDRGAAAAARPLPPIIATGAVLDSRGGVGAVGCFAAKLEQLQAWLNVGEVAPGSLFFYPSANAVPGLAAVVETLRVLRGRGLDCLGVSTLDDARLALDRLLEPHGRREDVNGRDDTDHAEAAEPGRPGGWPAEPGRLRIGINGVGASVADLEVVFHVGGADGRADALQTRTPPRLASGARFTIDVTAHRDAYLYIAHIDPAHNLRMLIEQDRAPPFSVPGAPHRVTRGDRFSLPGGDMHYRLDEVVGTERYYVIAAPGPVPGLRERIAALLAATAGATPQATPGGLAAKRTRVLRGASPMPNPHPLAQRSVSDPLDVIRPTVSQRQGAVECFALEHIAAPCPPQATDGDGR